MFKNYIESTQQCLNYVLIAGSVGGGKFESYNRKLILHVVQKVHLNKCQDKLRSGN